MTEKIKSNYASLEDLKKLWKIVPAGQEEKAEELLNIVSSELRQRAAEVGKNLDLMVTGDEDFANLAKSVTCDVVARVLMTSTEGEPVSQFSQTAGSYSVSGTYLVPGGGVFIKKNELARLGLRRQKYGVLEVYADD